MFATIATSTARYNIAVGMRSSFTQWLDMILRQSLGLLAAIDTAVFIVGFHCNPLRLGKVIYRCMQLSGAPNLFLGSRLLRMVFVIFAAFGTKVFQAPGAISFFILTYVFSIRLLPGFQLCRDRFFMGFIVFTASCASFIQMALPRLFGLLVDLYAPRGAVCLAFLFILLGIFLAIRSPGFLIHFSILTRIGLGFVFIQRVIGFPGLIRAWFTMTMQLRCSSYLLVEVLCRRWKDLFALRTLLCRFIWSRLMARHAGLPLGQSVEGWCHRLQSVPTPLFYVITY